MILRALFGIGLICLGASHLPGTDVQAAAPCSTRACMANPLTDANLTRAAIFTRLAALKSEIRNNSNSPMVSDAAVMGDNLHQLVERLPVTDGSRF